MHYSLNQWITKFNKTFWEKDASEAAALQILKYSQKKFQIGKKIFDGKQSAPNFTKNNIS